MPAPVASPSPTTVSDGDTLVIFHNNTGAMCLQALEWLEGMKSGYPDFVVREYLTTEWGTMDLLNKLTAPFDESRGLSRSFGYLPITLFDGQAFSGFDEHIQREMEDLMNDRFKE